METEHHGFGYGYQSGDDGDRTRDLQIANLALSQLSYIPLFTNNDEYSTIVRKMSTQEFR